MRDKRFYWGIGYGADMNGFGAQGAPRDGARTRSPTRSSRSTATVTFDRQQSGERVFDINKDGVAHYGLYPGLVARTCGQRRPATQIVSDMARGAEAYLQMWERVYGIRARLQVAAASGSRAAAWRTCGSATRAAQLLRRAGQPKVRGNYGWSWCVRGKKNHHRKLAAALTRGGKVALVRANAVNADAKRIRVGDPASRLSGHARSLGGGLFVRSAGPGKRFVYGVRKGRVAVRRPRDAGRLEEPGDPPPLRQAREAPLS